MMKTAPAGRPFRVDAARWRASYTDDCSVPVGIPFSEFLDELAEALRDPDPQIRDGEPYVVLRTWIERDVVAGEPRARLGALMAGRFTDPAIQARAFAPLVLDMIVGRGDYDPAWQAAFTRWFPAEEDLRGWKRLTCAQTDVAPRQDFADVLGPRRP
ncbi:hypothetical protein [Streptomyces sp. FIT100]|uniref:hypothetical protein n=1 Tax=Streptomyces sp. FIT100 TaxID=2837956 RepID=UPI0021C85186|nr:hypothetical protein [Streptomyces sp. FIT100]UUN29852.1 hypothetical protein KK483_28325 [Streptomyces sp. FIT100]